MKTSAPARAAQSFEGDEPVGLDRAWRLERNR